MMECKADLRRALLLRRRSMERETWLSASERVQVRLTGLPALREALKVHCYVSMEHDREVRTLGLLEWLAIDRKEVYMPYIERGCMRSARYQPDQRFRESKTGPPVPDPLVFSDEQRFDAVLVPLAGFDRKGGRIGFGQGWYDRFFEALSGRGIRPVRIGLAFGFQEVGSVPCDPWDKRLDIVVTEHEIVNCQNGGL